MPFRTAFLNANQQVFVNLLTNSRQALNGRKDGKIIIKADLVDGKVVIRLEDNGSGIPQLVLGKIFDPFFSTKPAGKGTGLGLSICYGILQQHGGHMWAESEEGVKTVFVIELPVIGHPENGAQNHSDR